MRVIPNAAAQDSIVSEQTALQRLDERDDSMVYLGSFMPYKDVATLARMAARLPHRRLHLLSRVTPAQQERWLQPLMQGEIRSAFAMTEPAVASSDATNIETSMVRDGDEYVINGRKWWTSGACDPRCKIMIFMGLTNPDAPRHAQHSMILVPMDTPGVKVLRPLPVFGYDDAPHGFHADYRASYAEADAKDGWSRLTALFAASHGVAHGLELPELSSPWGYATGFVLATAALHAVGYAAVRYLPQAAAPLVRIAGAASALTGAWLLAS